MKENPFLQSRGRQVGFDFKHRLSYVELTEPYVLEYISVYVMVHG
jgi:hypothetical protein